MSRLGVSLAVIGSLFASQALAAAAPAARLASVDGPVLVNQGAGFTPVTESTVLHPGDRLLSLRGAHAHLIYANGCAVSLKANAMLTVADMARGASCKVAAAQVADTDFTGDQAQAAGAAAASTAGAAGGHGGWPLHPDPRGSRGGHRGRRSRSGGGDGRAWQDDEFLTHVSLRILARDGCRGAPPGRALKAAAVFPLALSLIAIVASLLLGGASQRNAASLAAAELLCLPALISGIWMTTGAREGSRAWPLILLVAAILVPCLQLVPLPPSLWTRLPARAGALEVLSAAGLPVRAMP